MTAGALIWEVSTYGIFLLWLLGLVPAAVVTMLKGRWLYFGVGWLTFGIPWFFGALSMAAANSVWARRFYSEEKLARAASLERQPRSLQATVLLLGGTFVLLVALGLFSARPAPILGIGGSALQHSVGGGSLGSSTTPCLRIDRSTWRCRVYDDQFSGLVEYRVKTHRFGCWTAVRIGSPGEGSRKELTGCVTIWDKILG